MGTFLQDLRHQPFLGDAPPSRWPYLHVFILLLQAFISQKLVDGFGFPSCKGEAVRERQHCQELGTLR